METKNNKREFINVEVLKKGGRRYLKAISHEEYHILQKDENIIEIRPYSAKEKNRHYDTVTSGWAF